MATYTPPESLHVGTGTETVFGFNWPYLLPTDLVVTLNGLAVPTVLATPSQVAINPAPAAGTVVRIYRNTPAQVPTYLFAGGIPFLPRYVDENNKQVLYALQEGLLQFEAVKGTADEALRVAGEALFQSGVAVSTASRTEANLRKAVRAAPSEPDMRVLPPVAARAGRVMGFDSEGQPVGTLPQSGSGTELALQLAGPGGSALVGHADGGGPRISLADRLKATPAAASDRIQALLMLPEFGFNNGTTDTNLFPGASNAFQGISILTELDGKDYVYVAIRVAGASWTTAERCRICRWPLKTDGSNYDNIQISPPLSIGHGADITAQLEDDRVYIYTSASVLNTEEQGTNAGKGYSRIHWRGTSTSQSEIENYRVFGLVGSGHKFQDWNRATVALSDDRRWLILATAPLNRAYGRQVAVFDFAKLQALSDKTQAVPEYIWTMTDVKDQGGNVVQGACSDGQTVYFIMGGTDVFGQNSVVEYSLDGNLLRNTPIDGPAGRYGLDGLLNNAKGFPWRIEPEGICTYRGGVVVTFAEGWYAGAKVVSKRGENWAGIGVANTTGIPPANRSYFSRTTKPVTDGEWSDAVDYRNTTNLSNADKTLYYLGAPLGLAQEQGASAAILDQIDPSAVPTGQGSGATSMGMQYRSTFTFREWAAAYRTYFDRLTLDNAARLRLYDAREGGDNDAYVSVQANFTGTQRALVLRGSGTSAASAAWARYHAANCPTYPAAIVEGTGPAGSIRRVTDEFGTTSFMSSSGYPTMHLGRGNSGDSLTFTRAGVTIGGVAQNTAAMTLYGTEGVAVRIATTVGGVQVNRWEVSSSGILRPMTDGDLQLGTASLRISEIFAATGAINTSDARLKTPVRDVGAAELQVGRRLVREIGVWQWLSEIVDKGEDVARLHVGPTVQAAIAIFEESGLDPMRYGMVCYNEWPDELEAVEAQTQEVTDVGGNVTLHEVVPATTRVVRPAGSLYGFREGQVHALMLRALAVDFDALRADVEAIKLKLEV